MALWSDNTLMKGRLARRLVAVFVLASVLPVVLTSIVAYRELLKDVETRQSLALRDEAKSAGMNLLGQLNLVAAMIDAHDPGDTGLIGATQLLPTSLGSVQFEAAPAPDSLATAFDMLTSVKLAWLRKGEPVLYWGRDADGVSQLQMLILPGGGAWSARARLNSTALLSAAGLSGRDSTIFVTSAADSLRLIVDPEDLATVQEITGAKDPASSGLRTASWELPLGSFFAANPLSIQIAAPATRLKDELGSLGLLIPLALTGAMALAVWLALLQLRRYLGPVTQLTAATRKIADRDFDARVNIATGDEFGTLANHFNEMAGNLQSQFRTLEAVAEVDRLLLRAPSLENVLDALMPCMVDVLNCDGISILLTDKDSAHHVRAYDHLAGGPGMQPVRRLGMEHHTLAKAGNTADQALQQQLADQVFPDTPPSTIRFWPLSQGGRTAGLLCLRWDHDNSVRPADDAVERGFADRLTVALANLSHEQELLRRARFDGLTGLANRDHFIESLDARIAGSLGRNGDSALLYIDLDEFKTINDSAGHEAGDAVLVEIAARLLKCVEPGDTVARLGGDEFGIVLDVSGDPTRPAHVADRMHKVLREPVTVLGSPRRMSASIGIARIPADGDSVEALMRNADIAMYQAKEGGRDQVASFTPEMLARMSRKIELDLQIRQALQNDEFSVYYQPIVAGGRTVSVEALLRWQRPDGEQISPAVFIPVAEQNGMIIQIGSWIVRRVCADFADWRRSGLAPDYVSINVAPRQLHSDDFLSGLLDVVAAHGLRPDDIQIELTESAISDGQHVLTTLNELARHGFRIAMDDFGTGYSSLSHLHCYPFAVVKIDRSFVTDLPASRVAMQLVHTIIRMAHGLERTVVAEGVETQAQHDALLKFGCDAMQGYLFGKPMAGADFLARQRADQNPVGDIPQPDGIRQTA